MKTIMLFFTIFAPVIFVAQSQAIIDCNANDLPANCNKVDEPASLLAQPVPLPRVAENKADKFKTQSPPPAPSPQPVAQELKCKDAVKAYLSKAAILRLVKTEAAEYNAAIDKMGSEQLIPEPIDAEKETNNIIENLRAAIEVADNTQKSRALGPNGTGSEQEFAAQSIQLQKQYIHAYIEDKINDNFLYYYQAKYKLSCPNKEACANKPISHQLQQAYVDENASFFEMAKSYSQRFDNRINLNKAQSFDKKLRNPYEKSFQDCMVQ